MDFFTRFTHEKTPQNNFSSQNFSVENNYFFFFCQIQIYFEFQKPSHLPARDYITTLFEWIEHQIYDETLFPRDESVEFPKNFKKTCVKILGRMYRVFVHVYIHHFDRIKQLDHLNAEAHGNTLFKHFYYFVMEFQLLDEKELEPLEELIKRICI